MEAAIQGLGFQDYRAWGMKEHKKATLLGKICADAGGGGGFMLPFPTSDL